jgi:hypothetical protein
MTTGSWGRRRGMTPSRTSGPRRIARIHPSEGIPIEIVRIVTPRLRLLQLYPSKHVEVLSGPASRRHQREWRDIPSDGVSRPDLGLKRVLEDLMEGAFRRYSSRVAPGDVDFVVPDEHQRAGSRSGRSLRRALRQESPTGTVRWKRARCRSAAQLMRESYHEHEVSKGLSHESLF